MGNAPYPPVGTQSVSASAMATTSDQLYRYAEDLRLAIERQNTLLVQNQTLSQAYGRLTSSHSALERRVECSHEIHLITDPGGRILHGNGVAKVLAPLSCLVGTLLGDRVLQRCQ